MFGNPVPSGKYQKLRVVHDQVQPPELHRPVPAQSAVPRCALELPRLPAQQRQPVTPPFCNLTQTTVRELAEPQAVVFRHQRVPAPSLIRAQRPDRHLGFLECTPPEMWIFIINRLKKSQPSQADPRITALRLA